MTGAAVRIVCPGYDDRPGGVADHTRRLVRHWTDWGIGVHVLADTTEAPEHAAAVWAGTGVQAALLQYVPFLYGRRGLSRFPLRLARAARTHGLRVTTFVHEPWVPPTRVPWIVLSPLQRWQLGRLLAASDAAATPVPAWGDLLPETVRIIRVGSTLDHRGPDRPGPALTSPVVFSPFASGLRWGWIADAVRAIGSTPPLVVIGAAASEARAHHVVGRWVDPAWTWLGRLPAVGVAHHLARARLVLAPFVDGATGRRTSLCAALAAGAPTVSSAGPLLDPLFAQGPLMLAGTKEEFVEQAVRVWTADEAPARRAQRRTWHDRHLDPATLDRQLLELVTGRT